MIKKYLLFFFLFSFITSFADDSIPERPTPQRLVNNFSATGFLSPNDEQVLEQKLEAFSDSTSNQILIIIIDDLHGLEPWDFATKLGNKWGVGQAKFNNGIIILIKPSGGAGQRKYFIATGSGLEGAIPDITCRQIEQRELVPYLKSGNTFEALDRTTTVLMALAKGEYNSDAYGAKDKGGNKLNLAILLIIFIVFILISIMRGGGRGGNGLSMGAGFLLGSLLGGGGRRSGGFGDGGGFGGFGGGGFGGGGSGGSW